MEYNNIKLSLTIITQVNIMKYTLSTITAIALGLGLSSCQSASNAQRQAGIGAIGGGAAGAIIGKQSDHTAEGAIIGAAAGSLIGGISGAQKDKREGQ